MRKFRVFLTVTLAVCLTLAMQVETWQPVYAASLEEEALAVESVQELAPAPATEEIGTEAPVIETEESVVQPLDPVAPIAFEEQPMAFALLATTAAVMSSDLTGFLTSVNMYDSSGNLVNGGGVYIGDTYTFELSFAETQSLQMEYDANGYLTYQLPSDISVTTAVTTPIFSATGARIGWYSIDTTGLVKVWFDDVLLDGTPTPDGSNFIDYYPNVSLTIDVNAVLTGTDLNFGGGFNVVVTPLSRPTMLNTHKAAAYDPTSERINYTITITAVGDPGTIISNINLTDTQSVNPTPTKPTASQNIAAQSSDPVFGAFVYTLTPAGGAPVVLPNATLVTNWDNTSTVLYDSTGAPLTLNVGDTVTISYYIDLQTLLAENAAILAPNTAAAYRFQVKNLVTVTGNDVTAGAPGTPLAPVSSNTSNIVSKGAPITKTGTYNASPSPHITWTLTIGDGSTLLNGGTLTDTLDEIQSRLQFPATSGISVTVYDGNSNSKTTTANRMLSSVFSLTAGTPPSFKFTVPSSGALYPLANGTYDGTLWGDVYKIVLTYDTAVPAPGSSAVVYQNDASFNGTPVTATVPIVPTGFSVTKTTSGINGDPNIPLGPNGERYYIDYKIFVGVPAGQQGEPFYIYDTEGLMPAGAGFPNIPQNLTITASAPSAVTGDTVLVSGQDYYLAPPEGTRNNTFRIYFGGNSLASNSWPFDQAVMLTISYRLYISEDPAFNVLQKIQQNPGTISSSSFLMNTAYLINGRVDPWTVSADKTTYSAINVDDYWPIQKQGQATANPSVFNYTVSIWNGYTYSPTNGSPLFLQAGTNPVFTDTFDPRLEYVPGSFYINRATTYYGPAAGVGVTSGSGTLSADLSALLRFTTKPPVTGYTSGGTVQANWFAQASTYTVHYQLQLIDPTPGAGEPPLVLQNTAAIARDNTAGASVFQSSATVNYNVQPISKNMDYSSGTNVLPVSIIINPDGLTDFGAGTPGAPYNWVTAQDAAQNLTIFLNTVVFWTQTKNALGIWDGTWVQVPASQVGLNQNNQWSINAIDANDVNFVIPNMQPVKITYNALVPPTTPGQSIPIGNSINIFGLGASSDNPSYTVTGTQGGATAGITNLSVLKQDELDGSPLPGASFSLYAMRLDNPAAQPLNTTTPRDITAGPNTQTFYLVGSATTGSNGVASFLNNKAIDNTASLLFVLVETAAPSGYLLPAEPDNYTFFTINSAIPQNLVDGATALWGNIERATDFIQVGNLPAATLVLSKYIDGLYNTSYFPEQLTFLVQNMNKMGGSFDIPPIDFKEFTKVGDHWEYTVTGLEPGRYFVEESGGMVANHTMAAPLIVPAGVALNYGDTATIDITNTYTYDPPTDPTATVRKVFHGLPADIVNGGAYLTGFSLSATGPDGFSLSLDLADSQTGVSFDLTTMAMGDYTIDEAGYLDVPPEYKYVGIEMGGYLVTLPFTFTLSDDAAGNYYIDGIPVSPEGETLITFNNNYWPSDLPDPGAIVITKAFEGLPAGEQYEDISFLVQGTDANNNAIYSQTIPFSSLGYINGVYTTGAILVPAGNYTVTETGGQPLGAFDFTAPDPQHVTLASDSAAVVSIVNKYAPITHRHSRGGDDQVSGSGNGSDSFKTGDMMNLTEYLVMFSLSLVCLGVIFIRMADDKFKQARLLPYQKRNGVF